MTYQLSTRTQPGTFRKVVYTLFLQLFGDPAVSAYVLEKLIEVNDQDARVFHSKLRGAWLPYDKDNRPNFVKVSQNSPSLHKMIDQPKYTIDNNRIMSISPKKKGYGWKLKNIPLDLLREIEFHSSDIYSGVCLSDRKADVASFECESYALDLYNNYGNDSDLHDELYEQMTNYLYATQVSYLLMMGVVEQPWLPTTICPIHRYTLDSNLTIWIQYLCSEKEGLRYEVHITYKTPRNCYNPISDPLSSVGFDERDMAYGVLRVNRTEISFKDCVWYSVIEMKVGPNNTPYISWINKNETYSKECVQERNPELYKECEGLLLSIDECGINECLQDNFGFDICNPVMYEMFTETVKHHTPSKQPGKTMDEYCKFTEERQRLDRWFGKLDL